jgi:hypothetical protein
MKSNRAIFAVVMLVLTITSFWSTSAGQTLQARKVGVSLPSPRASSSVVFDGKDSVYIFGGYIFTKPLYLKELVQIQFLRIFGFL